MRAIWISLALAVGVTAASAQPRLSTTDMSCAQARALVAQEGALVLGTGGQTYDRFVRDLGFCQREETIRQSFVPTLDTPQCPIGFRCVQAERPFFRD